MSTAHRFGLRRDMLEENVTVDLEKMKKLGVTVSLIFLIATSVFYFQKVQGLETRSDAMEQQVSRLESKLNETESISEEEPDSNNRTLASLRERIEEMHAETGDLRLKVHRPLVETEYQSRQSSSSSTTVTLMVANYGNTTATGVQGLCQVYRDEADLQYDNFEVDIGKIANRTLGDIQTQVSLSEQPESSDQVLCRIQSCEGACQILHENIERFQTSSTVRNNFN
jgi:vacuolar-type H+-ATPase subunit I/STV1